MKYIEKDKAYKIVLHYGSYAASAKVADLPSIDLVRCGECKWYGIYEAKKDGTPDERYSPSVCLREIYARRRDPDWFCADGERKVQE